MSPEYSMKLTIGEATIEVKGDREGMIEIVREITGALRQREPLALPPAPVSDAPTPRESSGETAGASDEPSNVADARTLFAEKQPSTQIESAVVAAFYLAELAPIAERSETMSGSQFEDVLRRAGRPLPGRSRQVLVNAHTAGFLDRAGHGAYRLNNVGHNLVSHTLGSQP